VSYSRYAPEAISILTNADVFAYVANPRVAKMPAACRPLAGNPALHIRPGALRPDARPTVSQSVPVTHLHKASLKIFRRASSSLAATDDVIRLAGEIRREAGV
jgi:hypothetical protein